MIKTILFLISCFVIELVQSQLNGEFWWLNKKVAQYNRALIPPPTTEELSEFDNDDNTNIVFREEKDSSYSYKSTSHVTTITEPVRYSTETNYKDLDLNLIWPALNKDNSDTNGVVTANYIPSQVVSTITNVQSSNKTEELPFIFPDNNILKPKYKHGINADTTSAPDEQIHRPYDLTSSPITNSGDRRPDDNKEHKNIEYRPQFGNVNVANINNFEIKRPLNVSKNTINITPTSVNLMDNNDTYSWVFSNSNNSTDNKIHKSGIVNFNVDDRPKYNNINVANIDNVIYDSTNNFKLKQKDTPAAVQTQHMRKYNKITTSSPFMSLTTNNIHYSNKKESQQLFINNMDVNNIKNNDFILSNNDKNSQSKKLENQNNFIFYEKPSEVITNPKVPNKSHTDEYETENQFSFPERDNIIWNNIPLPNKITEKPWTAPNIKGVNFNDRPQFHNVIISTSSSTERLENTQTHTSTFKTSSPLSKQNTANKFGINQEQNYISYPHNDKIVWSDSKTSGTKPNEIIHSTYAPIKVTKDNSQPLIFNNDQVSHNLNGEKETESQNICTYLEKNECEIRKGFVYTVELQIMLAKKAHDPNLICCILPPIDNKYSDSKVIFKTNTLRRQKRSDIGNKTKEQKQRKALLERLTAQTQNVKLPTASSRIVSLDDEYVDPYWNIKNTKVHDKQIQNTRKKYDYSTEEYIQDYVDELPRPGLVGIYSDTATNKRNPSWSFINRKPVTSYGTDVVYDSVESEESFGYSTIDPRRVVKSKPKRVPPQKLSTVSNEKAIDPEMFLISFKSNPDFQAFQGFKLLNFAKNNEAPLKDENKSESRISEEILKDATSESVDYDSSENDQLFDQCGKAVKMNTRDKKDKQTGEADSGSHPWLALVEETKRRFHILCYATIIHSRAAITVAQCVFRTAPGEITLIAGLWNLDERTQSRIRIVSTYVHPKYRPGDRSNNVAILHWQQPLRLGVNVQPACLANYDVEEECMFFGWGQFDQDISPRSRWQKATIDECYNGHLSNKQNERGNIFCASLKTRHTVVNAGSPLICSINGRHSMVGFVVSDEDGLLLLNAHQWAKIAVKKLLHI